MEYACAVWHGSLREDIALSLERIQAALPDDYCEPTGLRQRKRSWNSLDGQHSDGGERFQV